jgi:hypothetical protein
MIINARFFSIFLSQLRTSTRRIGGWLVTEKVGLGIAPPEFAGKWNTKTISTSTNKKHRGRDPCPQRRRLGARHAGRPLPTNPLKIGLSTPMRRWIVGRQPSRSDGRQPSPRGGPCVSQPLSTPPASRSFHGTSAGCTPRAASPRRGAAGRRRAPAVMRAPANPTDKRLGRRARP